MMKISQGELTEKLLFDYYMIYSNRKNEVFSTIPHYINKGDFDKLKDYGEILDSLMIRIMRGINKEYSSFKRYMDAFPFKEEILTLNREITPVFWTRYDGFVRDEGGVFFSEFNYDKPCGQREILFTSAAEAKGNPNVGFNESFAVKFNEIINQYYSSEDIINTAVLVDPCHYEEHHLSHLFIDLLKNERVNVIAVGPKNLSVKEDSVWAFGRKVDIILRLFPTEFLYEVNDFCNIIKLYDKGKVLLLNDPRVIVCQAKSMFAYLYELIKNAPELLSDKEIEAINTVIPYTVIFDKNNIEDLIDNKDKYVIKAAFGRYSTEVYIGNLHSEKEWLEVIKYVQDSPKIHIVQEFCKIKKDIAYKAVDLYNYAPFESFGNFGMYMIEGKFAGVCARWSNDYLTDDDTTWITAIGVNEKSLLIYECTDEAERRHRWKSINEKAIFEHQFTGGYTGRYESFSITPLIIEGELEAELKYASNAICNILTKVQKLILNNYDIFLPLLGIDESLWKIVQQRYTDALCAVGRMDWVITESGELKLLEFNSETPAGIVEAGILSSLIMEQMGIPYDNPSRNLLKRIKDNIIRIINDFRANKEIKTIGFLTSTYYEDWYNTKIIKDLLEDEPYELIIGNINDAIVKEDGIYLYGKKLDCVYRYYPLDWFCEEDKKAFIDAFDKNTLSINPPHTIITQSKAIFVIIYELMEQGFFDKEEKSIINRYIPKTYFTPKKFKNLEYCVKPILSREGEGVKFRYELEKEPNGEVVYQERINIDYLNIKVYNSIGCDEVIAYPVLGTFIVDDAYSGIYTRVGNLITDRWAQYYPVYVKHK